MLRPRKRSMVIVSTREFRFLNGSHVLHQDPKLRIPLICNPFNLHPSASRTVVVIIVKAS